MTTIELVEVLRLHSLFLSNNVLGEKANLREANLRGADLREANLRGANLREADLREDDLREADLRWANLIEANLSWSNLNRANLRGADLSGSNLSWSNLSGADLSVADLSVADLSGALGDSTIIKTLQTTGYTINYYQDRLQIGCKNYSVEEWLAFSDYAISEMDCNALLWWTEWKPKLVSLWNLQRHSNVQP